MKFMDVSKKLTDCASRKGKVLIVDDEPDILNIYKYYLLNKNIRFEFASSFKEAKIKLKSPYDLIISDTSMETCRSGLDLMFYTELHYPYLSFVLTSSSEETCGLSLGNYANFIKKDVLLESLKSL